MNKLSCAGGEQRVADLDFMCEFATEKLIDEAANLRLFAKELTKPFAFVWRGLRRRFNGCEDRAFIQATPAANCGSR